MVKFQLCLRKLIIQAFKISVQVTIGITGLNGGQNWLLACSFQKASISKCWLVKLALPKLVRKLPLEVTPL